MTLIRTTWVECRSMPSSEAFQSVLIGQTAIDLHLGLRCSQVETLVFLRNGRIISVYKGHTINFLSHESLENQGIVSLLGTLSLLVSDRPFVNIFVLYIAESKLGAVLVLVNFDFVPLFTYGRVYIACVMALIQPFLQIHEVIYTHKNERNEFYVDRLVKKWVQWFRVVYGWLFSLLLILLFCSRFATVW